MQKAAKKMAKSHEDFIKELRSKSGDRFDVYNTYTNCHCVIEGYDNCLEKYFKCKAGSLLQRDDTPLASKMETEISKFLNEQSIEFIQQKTYDDLFDIGRLRFDFFIPSLNILIEYDGEQHYYKRRDDPDGSKLKKTQLHDKMKNEYCEKNNIPLLRISFREKSKYKEKILNFISDKNGRALNSENSVDILAHKGEDNTEPSI